MRFDSCLFWFVILAGVVVGCNERCFSQDDRGSLGQNTELHRRPLRMAEHSVRIKTATGQGSGSIVGQSGTQLSILSNGHVAKEGERCTVEFLSSGAANEYAFVKRAGRVVESFVRGTVDYCYIVCSVPDGVHYRVADCDFSPVEKGERLYVSGYPKGGWRVTSGVSLTGQGFANDAFGLIPGWSPGSSGSGVMDSRGNLRGVITLTSTKPPYFSIATIPADVSAVTDGDIPEGYKRISMDTEGDNKPEEPEPDPKPSHVQDADPDSIQLPESFGMSWEETRNVPVDD